MKMNDDKEMVLSLLEIAKAAIVTTIDSEGYPQTRAMFNLRNKEQWHAWFFKNDGY